MGRKNKRANNSGTRRKSEKRNPLNALNSPGTIKRNKQRHRRDKWHQQYYNTLKNSTGVIRNENSDDLPSTSGLQSNRTPPKKLTPRKLKPYENLLKFLHSQQMNKTVRSIKKRCRPQASAAIILNRSRLNCVLNESAHKEASLKSSKTHKKVRSPKKILQKNTRSCDKNSSVEEGEIIDDDDDGDDNDCMIIEKPIVSIVIDDDPPTTVDKKSCSKTVPLASSTLLNSSVSDEDNISFFIDTSGGFKKQNSGNATVLYNKRCTPLGVGKSPKSLRRTQYQGENITNTSDISANEPSDWSEVIDLDDTIMNDDSTIKPVPSDDSVICLSDLSPIEPVNFIPLTDANSAPRCKGSQNVLSPLEKNLINNNSLFSKSEKKELKAYNSNAYNPDSGTQNQKKGPKRTIIIDGCNVAMQHGRTKDFSVKGLKIVIEYFEKHGHEVKAVIPRYRLHKCTDPAEMNRLHDDGKIVVTPCKNVNGRTMSSYDDRVVLQLACELDGVVVSNDNYRDLVHENAAFKKLVENRVIGFTFCNDIFILPKDPYGRWGPSLQTILNR